MEIPQYILEQMLKDRRIRTELTRESHFYFFNFYFSHYVSYATAPFQKEMFSLTETDDNLFIVAFRGSGKSTMITTSYPIWSILGKQNKKFVLMLFQTQSQARQHLKNLKYELESNELLKNDLGPFQEESDEWGSNSLVFPQHNARITVASTEQSVRGLRHHQHRPDLIICDDLESLASVKTREGRDKIHQVLTGEVIPAGDKNTRLVIVGNLLHEDSLLMRIKKNLSEGRLEGIFKEYPLIDDNDKVLWPGKYPDTQSIQKEKLRVGNENAWYREFLLKIVYDEDQIIKREWITYYEELPDRDDEDNDYRLAAVAVDLGVKQSNLSDPTAMVGGHAFGRGDGGKIYISPEFFNQKVPLSVITEKAKELSRGLNNGDSRSRIIVEDVAAQNYVIQQIQTEGYYVTGFKPRGDKAERLMMISSLIQNGRVVFHRACEPIISQIVNFGLEKHDDLCDALVILVTELIDVIGHSSSGFPDPESMLKDNDYDEIVPGERMLRLRRDMIF